MLRFAYASFLGRSKQISGAAPEGISSFKSRLMGVHEKHYANELSVTTAGIRNNRFTQKFTELIFLKGYHLIGGYCDYCLSQL